MVFYDVLCFKSILGFFFVGGYLRSFSVHFIVYLVSLLASLQHTINFIVVNHQINSVGSILLQHLVLPLQSAYLPFHPFLSTTSGISIRQFCFKKKRDGFFSSSSNCKLLLPLSLNHLSSMFVSP